MTPKNRAMTKMKLLKRSRFRIVSHKLGLYVAGNRWAKPWTDNKNEAEIFEEFRDIRQAKLAYWQSNAAVAGLDPESFVIEDC